VNGGLKGRDAPIQLGEGEFDHRLDLGELGSDLLLEAIEAVLDTIQTKLYALKAVVDTIQTLFHMAETVIGQHDTLPNLADVAT
jgi:hypothetical protein